jgi:hypothetical protein
VEQQYSEVRKGGDTGFSTVDTSRSIPPGPPVRRYIVRSAILLVRVGGTFGMICRVFDALDRRCFLSLVGIRQFLNTFRIGVFDLRKLLRIEGLARTVRSDLTRIGA